jgi:AP-2 complex subunit alpha
MDFHIVVIKLAVYINSASQLVTKKISCIFRVFCTLCICYLSCSIRRRALDLLYGMCDVTNAKEIVEELLQVTTVAIIVLRMKNNLKTLLAC